jgi:hypothetical protein
LANSSPDADCSSASNAENSPTMYCWVIGAAFDLRASLSSLRRAGSAQLESRRPSYPRCGRPCDRANAWRRTVHSESSSILLPNRPLAYECPHVRTSVRDRAGSGLPAGLALTVSSARRIRTWRRVGDDHHRPRASEEGISIGGSGTVGGRVRLLEAASRLGVVALRLLCDRVSYLSARGARQASTSLLPSWPSFSFLVCAREITVQIVMVHRSVPTPQSLSPSAL